MVETKIYVTDKTGKLVVFLQNGTEALQVFRCAYMKNNMTSLSYNKAYNMILVNSPGKLHLLEASTRTLLRNVFASALITSHPCLFAQFR
jgi:hypothetical protein